MVSTSVSRTLRYLAGMDNPDEEQQPSLLDSLGQGISSVGAGISQGISDAGTAISSGISSAAQTVSDAYAVPPEERPPAYSGPSYAQPSLAPGQPSMQEQLPEVGAAGISRAAETLGDRGALLSGLRRPETALEVAEQAAPAPARAVQIASEVGSSFGAGAGRRFAEGTVRPDEDPNAPLFTTPEVGPIPAYPVTRGDVGAAVGTVLGDPTTYLGFGAAGRAADAPVDAAMRAAGRSIGAAPGAVGRGVRAGAGAVGDLFQGNAARTAAADARMAAEGSTAAPALFGALPEPGGARRGVPTVEAISEQLSAARDARSRAVLTGDAVTEAAANDHMRSLEEALADAVNARRELEPRITSDIGRQANPLTLTEESADDLTDAMRPREAVRGAPGDLSGPVGIPVDMSGRANASAGAAPPTPGTGVLPAVNRALGQGVMSSVSGGVGAAVNQELNPDDPYAAAKGFAVGALGPLAAQRGARGLARLAGAAPSPGGGALATLGAVPSPNISPLGQRVHDTYTAVTPERTQRATERTIQIASDAIAARIPRKGGMQTAPTDLVRSVHDTIVKNLQDTKIVATGIRPGAIQAYLRGEGLTSKVDTRDLAQINEITKGQVNVAGGRAGEPYTLSQAADFAQRESEQMRVATGGTRFPDPETGLVDEEAPRVMYGYVSEGQPLVGPNRPTVWLVWDDDTPRITSAHHPYGLTSPGQDIHASMPPGLKAAIWSENAIQGARHGPAVMEGGRLVEAAPGVPGTSPMAFGWEQAGVDVGGGRKIADTNWLVGPEGEDAMRANGLILGMPQTMQRAIAGGAMTDPEEIAAILMRGGSPKWKGGWGAVMNPSRSESLILDPDISKIKALYITGTPKDLAAKLTGGGRTGPQITELGVAQKLRQDVLAATNGEKDIPILFNDVSKSAPSAAQQAAGATLEGWSPRLISDAQLLEGPPMTLAPGRAGIRDRYVAAGMTDIGATAGAVPRLPGTGALPAVNRALSEGIAGGFGGAVIEQGRNPDEDPRTAAARGFAAGAVGFPIATRAARGAARLAGAAPSPGGGALATLGGGLPGDGGAARRARLAAQRAAANPTAIANLAGQAASVPMTGSHTNGQHVTRNVARQIQKQAAAGVPPHVPTAPMPPPDPPPSWWDHMENWRYNVGLFAQLSTGMIQAAGGVIQAAGGGAAEALRLGVLKGQPEALLPIAGEALKSIPGGIKSAALTAAGQVPKAIQAGSDYKPPVHAREFAQGNIGRGAASWAVGLPGRVMTQAPDALWHEMFYKTGVAQAAADEAQRQVGSSPLRMGDRLRIQRDLIENPTPEIVDEATKLAQNATYKGEPGRVLGVPKKVTEALGPVGSFFMPIYNTIARIHEQALEYTPGVGLLPLEKIGLAPKNQARPVSRRIAQQAVGGSLVLGGLSYAAAGGIRGPGPSNPNEAQAMRDQGYTPNTTNVGGYWIPNTWFGPWGPILNEIGAVNDARLYDHGDAGWDDLTWEKKAAAIIKMSGRAAADYPALDTAQTITKLFTAPEDALPSFLGEVAAQYVPGPLRTKAMAEDTKARTRTRGPDVPFEQRFWETVKQRSGVGREELPVAQDILGREVANPRQGWGRALAPNIREEKPDPIIQAYLDANLNIGDPATELTVPSLKDTDLKPQLTPEETRRWNTLRGESIIRRTEGALSDPRWAERPPENRQQFLERARTAAAEEAHARLRSEIGAQEITRRISEARATKQRRAS